MQYDISPVLNTTYRKILEPDGEKRKKLRSQSKYYTELIVCSGKESLLTLVYHAALLLTNHKTDSSWHHITTEDKTAKVDAIQICRTYDKKHLITSIQSNPHYCSNAKQSIYFGT